MLWNILNFSLLTFPVTFIVNYIGYPWWYKFSPEMIRYFFYEIYIYYTLTGAINIHWSFFNYQSKFYNHYIQKNVFSNNSMISPFYYFYVSSEERDSCSCYNVCLCLYRKAINIHKYRNNFNKRYEGLRLTRVWYPAFR